jgi:multidrug resistance efflux pump
MPFRLPSVSLRPAAALPAAVLLAAAALGCAPSGAATAPVAGTAAGDGALRVVRDDFRRTLLLSGELEAAEAHVLSVPRSPSWRLEIRWLEQDGARVVAGQPVVEFENSQFTSDLEEKRLAVSGAVEELTRLQAEAAQRRAEKSFAVEQRQAEVDRARLKAEMPAELIAAAELERRRLDLRSAETGLAKAQENLEAERRSTEADLALQRLALDRARREVATAETALEALRLTAPTDGILVIEDHPWEGRKVEAGDTVWTGLTVARIPDLRTLRARAVLFDVDHGQVEPGMPAACTVDAYPDLGLAGRVAVVSQVAREVERTTRRRYFVVDVDLDGVDPERMRPGMSVKTEVVVDARDGVLTAPREALDLDAEPPRAALAGGGRAEIALGPCNATRCVVESGLTEGQRLEPVATGASG